MNLRSCHLLTIIIQELGGHNELHFCYEKLNSYEQLINFVGARALPIPLALEAGIYINIL